MKATLLVLRPLPAAGALLLAVSFGLFLAAEVLPGDPAVQALGSAADPVRLEQLRGELGLDRPFAERYLDWLGGLLTGDLGTSALTGLPVGPLIAERAAHSLVLAGAALLLVVCVALPLGVLAGSRPGGAPDRWLSLGALALVSVPEFVLATVLIAVFAHGLHWLPPVSLVGAGAGALAEPDKLVLPAATLAAVAGSFALRLIRATVAEVAGSAHVEAARLAGIPERHVLVRHLLPSVRGPVAQTIALVVPYLVGGALVVETAFGYPGLAGLAAEAIARRDAVLLSGAGVVLAGVAVTGFLLAEMAGGRS